MSGQDWMLALLIFLLRIGDVSLGTLRTISVVQGKMYLSVVLGFFEVAIWILAVAQVFAKVQTAPLLIVAYAAGFAGGNAVGIAVERMLALGNVVLRIISPKDPKEITKAIEPYAKWLTTFQGTHKSRTTTLFYVICSRRQMRQLLGEAKRVDPEVFFMIEALRESNLAPDQPLPHATGWRALFKKK